MDKKHDVLIIGGGIIGHSISYSLNKNGIPAMVAEKQASGKKATRAAAGMLGVHTENLNKGWYHQFCAKSRDLYCEWNEELRELTAIDIGLSSFGMLEVAFEEGEKKKLQSKKDAFPELEWLEAPSLKRRMPSSSTNALGALYMKQDGHVEPALTCEAFKKAALLFGGGVLENQTVLRIEKKDHRFLVELENETLPFNHVVVASGAESGRWFETAGLENPMVPTKGECFSLKPRNNPFNETLFLSNFYIVPKRDGRYIVGATSKPYDQRAYTTGGGLYELMNRVFARFPELKDASLEDYWSGVRPGTMDGLPIIGEHPTIASLYYATGHYRNGILLAPATGQMIKDMIANREVDPSIKELFSPSRLSMKGESHYQYSS